MLGCVLHPTRHRRFIMAVLTFTHKGETARRTCQYQGHTSRTVETNSLRECLYIAEASLPRVAASLT